MHYQSKIVRKTSNATTFQACSEAIPSCDTAQSMRMSDTVKINLQYQSPSPFSCDRKLFGSNSISMQARF